LKFCVKVVKPLLPEGLLQFCIVVVKSLLYVALLSGAKVFLLIHVDD